MEESIDLKAALLDSFKKQKYCDVTFTCKESKSNKLTKIGAHKAVLASVSDVFGTMFFGEIVKNDGVSKEAEIKIEDIHMEAFQAFLGFIYGKKITFDCTDIAFEFLYAADKYNCNKAKKFIEGYILKDVDAQNAVTYYETAEMMSLKLLKQACLEVFQEKTLEVLCCPNLVNAKPDTLHKIFSVESHNTTESYLVWALERYINFNASKDPKITEKVRPALSCIRFLTLDKKDVARTTLLSKDEKKGVMDKSLKKDQGLSLSYTERGISGNMEMVQAVQSLYSDKFCCMCASSNGRSSAHPFWLCTPQNTVYGGYMQTSITEQNAKVTLKEIYVKYNHTVLSMYKASDVKKVHETYKFLGYLNK